MSQGGRESVSSIGGWPHLSFVLQGNSKLGTCLEQVYNYYLAPLEDHLPKDIRPARARQWMEQYSLEYAQLFSPKEKSKADEIVNNMRKRLRPLQSGRNSALASNTVEERACKIIRAMALDVTSTTMPSFAQECFLDETGEDESSNASEESVAHACSEEAAQSDTKLQEGETMAAVEKEHETEVGGLMGPFRYF